MEIMTLRLKHLLASAVFSCIPSVLFATIDFGSRSSSVEVGNGASLHVAQPMLISGGRLKRFEQGVIAGRPVTFDVGVFASFNSESGFTGRYVPAITAMHLADPEQRAKTGTLQLTGQGGQVNTLVANPGGLNHQLQIQDGINFLRGQPLFFGAQDLVFQSENSLLAIAIQNTLNTNMVMKKGGVLFLQDDLRLGDNALIDGDGTVILNNRRLSLGGAASEWKGEILWQQALDVQLNSLTRLTGVWYFAGDSQINGNGNVLDIAGTGAIVVLPGSTLRMSGVRLKGVGSGFLSLASDAKLILSDMEIELDANVTLDSGFIRVDGNTNIITKDKFFTIAPGGFLEIDRVALTYDPLDFVDQFNIRPLRIQDPGQELIRIINGGSIRKIRAESISFLDYSSDTVLERYGVATPNKKIQIFPEVNLTTGQQNFNVTVNGNTNFLLFTRSDEPLLIITDNVKAKYQNVVLREFSPKHVSLGQGASLVFGDKTSVEFARDEELNYPWVFEGTSYLRGRGSTFTLGPTGSIVVQGANSIVTLENMSIKGVATDRIKILDPSSIVVLKNVRFIQEDAFVHSVGGFYISGTTTFVGPYPFVYQATSPLRILEDATLMLTRDAQFFYQPSNGDRSLLQLADFSASLWLEQASITAPTGFQLLGGRLVIRGRNQLQTGDSSATGVVLGDGTAANNVVVDQPSSASLETTGALTELIG